MLSKQACYTLCYSKAPAISKFFCLKTHGGSEGFTHHIPPEPPHTFALMYARTHTRSHTRIHTYDSRSARTARDSSLRARHNPFHTHSHSCTHADKHTIHIHTQTHTYIHILTQGMQRRQVIHAAGPITAPCTHSMPVHARTRVRSHKHTHTHGQIIPYIHIYTHRLSIASSWSTSVRMAHRTTHRP